MSETGVILKVLNSRGLLAIGALPVICILAAGLLFSSVVSDAAFVAHTLGVKHKLSRLFSNIQDIEVGQRGYLITGNETFLEPYREAVSRIEPMHKELLSLVSDNPSQVEALQTVKPLIDERIETAKSNIAARRLDAIMDTGILDREARGKVIMDQVRRAIELAQAEEDRIFVQRVDALAARRAWLSGALAAALFAAAGVIYNVWRQHALQRATQEHLNDSLQGTNTLLEKKVEERTRALALERDRAEILLRDVTHRIGNTLTLVVGFLNLQIRHAKDAGSIKTLSAARERVMTISSAQRRMNVANDLELVRIDKLIVGVLDDLRELHSLENIEIDIDIPELHVPARQSTSVCVLPQEYVINAMKHGFPDGRSGRIRVSLHPLPEKGAVLEITDDGIGLPSEGDVETGLGMQIAERMARQFEGNISVKSGNGVSVSVTLPGLTVHRLNGSTPPADFGPAHLGQQWTGHQADNPFAAHKRT